MLRRTLLLLLFTWFSGAAFAVGKPTILVLGDSISAGYGLESGQGWVAQLEQRLVTQGHSAAVVNASISGDTTAGGLYRLDRLLAIHQPELLILELGGNDGLRGMQISAIRNNLTQIIEKSRASGSRVLLLGMRLPPNYGADYTEAFHAVFREVATAQQVPLVPFLLAGLEDRLDEMQADGIHPGPDMQPAILENVWRELKPLLDETQNAALQ